MVDMKLIWIRTPNAKGKEEGKRKKNEIEYRECARALGMLYAVACGQINSKRLNPGISNWIYWNDFFFRFLQIRTPRAHTQTSVWAVPLRQRMRRMHANVYTCVSHAHGCFKCRDRFSFIFSLLYFDMIRMRDGRMETTTTWLTSCKETAYLPKFLHYKMTHVGFRSANPTQEWRGIFFNMLVPSSVFLVYVCLNE